MRILGYDTDDYPMIYAYYAYNHAGNLPADLFKAKTFWDGVKAKTPEQTIALAFDLMRAQNCPHYEKASAKAGEDAAFLIQRLGRS